MRQRHLAPGLGLHPTPRPGRLSAFLGRIARNLALDRYDYNHAAKRSGPFDQLLSELSECIPCQRDDFAQLELTQILNSFLHSLPESRRNLFLRRYCTANPWRSWGGGTA